MSLLLAEENLRRKGIYFSKPDLIKKAESYATPSCEKLDTLFSNAWAIFDVSRERRLLRWSYRWEAETGSQWYSSAMFYLMFKLTIDNSVIGNSVTSFPEAFQCYSKSQSVWHWRFCLSQGFWTVMWKFRMPNFREKGPNSWCWL